LRKVTRRWNVIPAGGRREIGIFISKAAVASCVLAYLLYPLLAAWLGGDREHLWRTAAAYLLMLGATFYAVRVGTWLAGDAAIKERKIRTEKER
jgi:multidrug efflux pump subunit AcrB